MLRHIVQLSWPYQRMWPENALQISEHDRGAARRRARGHSLRSTPYLPFFLAIAVIAAPPTGLSVDYLGQRQVPLVPGPVASQTPAS